VRDGVRRVKVKAFSEAYFALLDRVPDLRETLALGDRVTVSGRAVVLEIGTSGVERMSDAELAGVARDW
jgi:hypothetical protein